MQVYFSKDYGKESKDYGKENARKVEKRGTEATYQPSRRRRREGGGRGDLGCQLAGGVSQLVDKTGKEGCLLLRPRGQQISHGAHCLLLDDVQVVSTTFIQSFDKSCIPGTH